MVKVTFWGHAAFVIEGEDVKVAVDPFISGNPRAPGGLDSFPEVDFIVVTHAHGDHLGDAVALSKKFGALVLCNFEISNRINGEGGKAHPLYVGGAYKFNQKGDFVKFFPAVHGSSFPDGSYGGLAVSAFFDIDDVRVFHSGDTGLTREFLNVKELYGGVDLALLCVGGNFTMDPEEAAKAAEFLGAKNVVPMHYSTWDIIAQEENFIAKHFEGVAEVKFLSPGESVEV